MKKISVLVINEKVLIRKQIALTVDETGFAYVAHFSSSMEMGIEWLMFNTVDIVITSCCYGNENSEEFMQVFKEICSVAKIIILSENSVEPDKHVHMALSNIEIQFITENELNQGRMRDIFEKIRSDARKARCEIPLISTVKENSLQLGTNVKSTNAARPFPIPSIITIASSTGGPVALQYLLENLQMSNSVPILIIQHIPPEFSAPLAKSLSKKSGKNVVEAEDGMQISAGVVYIAPGGYHMTLEDKKGMKIIKLIKTPFVNGVRPAADVFLESVANKFCGLDILNIILTGMGCDAMKGTRILKERCNIYTICQDEESSVVFGMPGSAIANGLADEVLGIKDIPGRISVLTTKGGALT